MSAIRDGLKVLNQQYTHLAGIKASLREYLLNMLDQTYPGIDRLFTSPVQADGRQKWVDFARDHYHVDLVRGMSEISFVEHYAYWCRDNNYYSRESKAKMIYEHACSITGVQPMDNLTQIMIQQQIQVLNAASAGLESVRNQMLDLASRLPEYETVMSLNGVGRLVGLQLIAELGDVSRFFDSEALAAFAGVLPGENTQSSPALRQALISILDWLLTRAPAGDPVYQVMAKDRAAGVPYYAYMTAGAREFLRVYYDSVTGRAG